jgi:putative DNA primase/helicase
VTFVANLPWSTSDNTTINADGSRTVTNGESSITYDKDGRMIAATHPPVPQIENVPLHKTKTNTNSVKGLVINSMSDTTPEITEWIWYRYLPKKRLAILAGVGSAGKSTLTLSMAATISCGGRWPDGSDCPQGKVLLWSGEDLWTEDVVPRLAAMGANPNNIFNIEAAIDDKGNKIPFNAVRDVPRITEILQAYPGIALVIISPLVSLVKGDMNATNITRDGLQSLVDMAQQTSVCVLGITHFRKDSEGQIPVHRVMGSAAFTQLPRVVMGVVKSGDGLRRALAVIKGNNGKETLGAIEYEIKGKEVTYNNVTVSADLCSIVEWHGHVPGNAHDVFNDIEEVQDKYITQLPKVDEAMRLLQTLLANGATLSKAEMYAEATKAGITSTAISRAIKQLGVEWFKVGMTGGFRYKLPLQVDIALATPNFPKS